MTAIRAKVLDFDKLYILAALMISAVAQRNFKLN